MSRIDRKKESTGLSNEDEKILILGTFLGIPAVASGLAGTTLEYSYQLRGYNKPDRKFVFNARCDGDAGHYVVREWHTRNTKFTTDDSYQRRYQQKGSNGLCMVFAAMIYRNETDELVAGDWVDNTWQALYWAWYRLDTFPNKHLWVYDLPIEVGENETFMYKVSLFDIQTIISEMTYDKRYLEAIARQEFYH